MVDDSGASSRALRDFGNEGIDREEEHHQFINDMEVVTWRKVSELDSTHLNFLPANKIHTPTQHKTNNIFA
jgi:hypothetical protein